MPTSTELKEELQKKQSSIDRINIVRDIIVRGLVNLIQVALLYAVVVVVLPLIFNKDLKDLRDVSLMTFIGLIFLFILALLIIATILNEKTKSYTETKQELTAKLIVRLQTKKNVKKTTQENDKDGKEMVSK